MICGTETEVEEADERLCDDCSDIIRYLHNTIKDGMCPLCRHDDVFMAADPAYNTHNLMCGKCGAFYPLDRNMTSDMPSPDVYNHDPEQVMRSVKEDTDDENLEDVLNMALRMMQ